MEELKTLFKTGTYILCSRLDLYIKLNITGIVDIDATHFEITFDNGGYVDVCVENVNKVTHLNFLIDKKFEWCYELSSENGANIGYIGKEKV